MYILQSASVGVLLLYSSKNYFEDASKIHSCLSATVWRQFMLQVLACSHTQKQEV